MIDKIKTIIFAKSIGLIIMKWAVFIFLKTSTDHSALIEAFKASTLPPSHRNPVSTSLTAESAAAGVLGWSVIDLKA